ncbi:MFS transporter [Chelativorans salis]|uniref:MFS transporter n=1 Tax=Chelativorans salis TaxID=2978478 RepID=A0ABT2LRS9_9HYPH|nr:MFS transporter [Chelativorans sp. EGI FJ00035]MCT7376542.1 MFS transporter [Chelativorans sp. EGI FJ00035]
MLSSFGSIVALLFGTAFLLAASGLYGLLLPLRGEAEGFSTTALGLLGTAWASGFIAGCFIAPRLVRRVGHVRAFSAFAATGAIVALLSGMWVDVPAWLVLRAFTGFTMAGAFMVIESWLNERSTNATRGTVFGLYMMVTHASIMAGQMVVTLADVSTSILFMATGILFCLALLPTAVSTAITPAPLADVSIDLKGLYTNSPVACVGCLLIGAANGAWGTMGAVYGAEIGISTLEIALMMSIAVLAGAAAQLPAGRLSDHTDRRFVLAGGAFGSALIGLTLFLTAPRAGGVVIAMTAFYGLLAYTLYSIVVAHANDHAPAAGFAKVSSGLLLLYGIGTMGGPVIAGVIMQWLRPESLFLVTAAAHLAIALYAALRISRRAPVPFEEREAFKSLPAERAVTPQTVMLDPRTDTEETDTESAQ